MTITDSQLPDTQVIPDPESPTGSEFGDTPSQHNAAKATFADFVLRHTNASEECLHSNLRFVDHLREWCYTEYVAPALAAKDKEIAGRDKNIAHNNQKVAQPEAELARKTRELGENKKEVARLAKKVLELDRERRAVGYWLRDCLPRSVGEVVREVEKSQMVVLESFFEDE